MSHAVAKGMMQRLVKEMAQYSEMRNSEQPPWLVFEVRTNTFTVQCCWFLGGWEV